MVARGKRKESIITVENSVEDHFKRMEEDKIKDLHATASKGKNLLKAPGKSQATADEQVVT